MCGCKPNTKSLGARPPGRPVDTGDKTTRAVYSHRDIRTWFDKFEVPGRPRDVVAMLIFQDDAIATRIL